MVKELMYDKILNCSAWSWEENVEQWIALVSAVRYEHLSDRKDSTTMTRGCLT